MPDLGALGDYEYADVRSDALEASVVVDQERGQPVGGGLNETATSDVGDGAKEPAGPWVPREAIGGWQRHRLKP